MEKSILLKIFLQYAIADNNYICRHDYQKKVLQQINDLSIDRKI